MARVKQAVRTVARLCMGYALVMTLAGFAAGGLFARLFTRDAAVLAEAARVYGDPEAALKLRTMLMQYDTVKKSKGTVVTVPTAMSDGFTDSAMMNGDRTTER